MVWGSHIWGFTPSFSGRCNCPESHNDYSAAFTQQQHSGTVSLWFIGYADASTVLVEGELCQGFGGERRHPLGQLAVLGKPPSVRTVPSKLSQMLPVECVAGPFSFLYFCEECLTFKCKVKCTVECIYCTAMYYFGQLLLL